MDYSQFKICIGVPQPELTDIRFNMSLTNLMLHSAPYLGGLHWSPAVGCRVAHNRNRIVEKAKELDVTHILWLDADSEFPISGLIQLLRHQKDVVGATTCKRDGSDSLMLIDLLEADKLRVAEPLARVVNIGFPFMLTKMSVFDQLEAPWFAEPPVKLMKKIYPEINLDQPDDGLLGEDIYFCAMARRAGLDLWCDIDLSLQIGHIGSRVHYVGFDPRPAGEANVDIKLVA